MHWCHTFGFSDFSLLRGSLFTVFGESFPTTMAGEPEKAWSSALLDCFEDMNTCCYGFWCGPCLACTVSGRFGETYCFPLCDIVPMCMSATIGIPICVPPAALSTRAAMRNRYHIRGSLCDDAVVSCFCSWCSWCQMHRELKYRNIIPVVINMAHQTVIQMQNQNMPQMQNQNMIPMQNQNMIPMQNQNMIPMQDQNMPQMQPIFVTTAQPQPVGYVSPPAYKKSP
ncbi:protein PLANT CADMIUM RESISTANCE 7-like [Notothenia coriiceps]|uniref:Protein PLANT CADMIUM RESISTANCE 7-like n=1 Tax=Notothenia coriiceps TaxID=8208 RepID=A0A6I9PPV3_9TELE|nr:PREDICTED: protein PLANT CADMIUM RESISTANCE 7-like [Notothenia coriiceps]